MTMQAVTTAPSIVWRYCHRNHGLVNSQRGVHTVHLLCRARMPCLEGMSLHRTAGGHGVVPGAVRSDQDIGLWRSPGAGLIRAHRRLVHEDRVDDAPGRFHFVLAREAQRLSGHGGDHESVVWIPQCVWIPTHIQLDLFRQELPARGHDRCADGDFYVRTEPETEVVGGANSDLSP